MFVFMYTNTHFGFNERHFLPHAPVKTRTSNQMSFIWMNPTSIPQRTLCNVTNSCIQKETIHPHITISLRFFQNFILCCNSWCLENEYIHQIVEFANEVNMHWKNNLHIIVIYRIFEYFCIILVKFP